MAIRSFEKSDDIDRGTCRAKCPMRGSRRFWIILPAASLASGAQRINRNDFQIYKNINVPSGRLMALHIALIDFQGSRTIL